MKRSITFSFGMLLVAFLLSGSSQTGVYFALSSKVTSHLFPSSSASPIASPYSRDYWHGFVSLYGENFFEVSLSLGKDNYWIEETAAYRPRYQIGFEAGKLISFALYSKGRRIVSPDASVGLFARIHFMGSSGSQKIENDWGVYGSVKVKINRIRDLIRVRSVDIGYKAVLPVHFSYYRGDRTVLSAVHFLFIGISL